MHYLLCYSIEFFQDRTLPNDEAQLRSSSSSTLFVQLQANRLCISNFSLVLSTVSMSQDPFSIQVNLRMFCLNLFHQANR
jgi:hypothetical protein